MGYYEVFDSPGCLQRVVHSGKRSIVTGFPVLDNKVVAAKKMYPNGVALISLIFAVVVGLAQWLISLIRVQTFQRQTGCKPAAAWGQSDPILGLDQFRLFKQNAADRRVLESLSQRYLTTGRHTQTLRLMGQSLVMTCEPENVKAVLATKFHDFGIGSRMGAMGRLLGHGIFTTDGAHWEHSRVSNVSSGNKDTGPDSGKQALIRPSFTRAQVSDLECVETHVQNLIAKLPADGETVDVQRLFFNLTIDNATEFLLGRSINCQTNPAMSYFSEAWDHAEGCLTGRVRLGKLVGLVDGLRTDAGFEKACDTVHAFVDSYIADTLAQGQNKESAVGDDGGDAVKTRRYNLLSELSAVCRDPAQLRSELLNVLLAARDTTAGLLSSILYFVARHADVWAALAAEVEQLEGRVPDYDRLKRMRVLRSIIDESKLLRAGWERVFLANRSYSVSSAPPSARPRQHALRRARHDGSARWWPRRPLARLRRQRRRRALLGMGHASAADHLRRRR